MRIESKRLPSEPEDPAQLRERLHAVLVGSEAGQAHAGDRGARLDVGEELLNLLKAEAAGLRHERGDLALVEDITVKGDIRRLGPVYGALDRVEMNPALSD